MSIPIADNPAPSAAAADNRPSRIVEYTQVPNQDEGDPPVYYTFHTPFEYYLTILTVGILAAALIVLAVMGWRSGMTPDFTRTFIIIVVVFAALFLISAGYSDQQAAPVYGLLGTIAGYIFGRMPKDEPATTEQTDDKKPAPEERAA